LLCFGSRARVRVSLYFLIFTFVWRWMAEYPLDNLFQFRLLELDTAHVIKTLTRWRVIWESTNPRESVFVSNTWQHLTHLLFCGPLVSNFPTELFCKRSPVYGVFDRYFHILLPIVSKHDFGLPFSPRNIRIKFGANSSTIILAIVVTHRHTHKPTPVNTYSLAFAGIIIFTTSVHQR